MSESQMASLIGLEYELCGLYGELHSAARDVAASGVSGSHAASRDLHLARRLVRRAMKRLDAPLTEAAKLAESMAQPPF